MSMNRNLRSLVEGSSAKTHWPEQVKKGKKYDIEFHADRKMNGLHTFVGWAVTANGPIMQWQDKQGKEWQAIMYDGEMRFGNSDSNSRFTIGYED